ncbi:hypothetical protein ACLQ2Y_29035 [Micromonospora echinospora]|uniref:hypothetical protein n=1 Tax=Micromonospora echinospora TaxID=1877 RepID=UPI003CF0B1EA
MRRRSLIVRAAAGIAAPVVVSGATPAAAASPDATTDPPRPRHRTWTPSNKASGLRTLPATTRQVVVVTAASWNTSYATLETFAKADGHWTAVSGALSARIGSQFFSDNHVEGTPTTPTGVYAFGPRMYGIAANPGVRYPYHQVVTGDQRGEDPLGQRCSGEEADRDHQPVEHQVGGEHPPLQLQPDLGLHQHQQVGVDQRRRQTETEQADGREDRVRPQPRHDHRHAQGRPGMRSPRIQCTAVC